MKKILTTLSLVTSTVAVALAQAPAVGTINGSGLLNLLALAQGLVSRLIPFAVSLAVLAFFWFLVKFIWKGSEDAKEKGAAVAGMGYSILALFVMVSIWGLVGFLGSMLGIGQGGSVPIPTVPVPIN
jgi:hypothetical protein